MACVLTTGNSLGCRDSVGGLQKVYIGLWNGPLLTYTYNADNSIGTFSGTTVSFYGFEQEAEVGSYEEKLVPSNENQTGFYEQTLSITLYKLDATLRNQLHILEQGRWRIIILDQLGTYRLMGWQNPVRVSVGDGGLGKAYGDLNGCVVTFLAKQPLRAHIVSSAAALSVMA